MGSERWQQIERLYHSALQREPDLRRAFLSEACGGDEDLLREVESLLAQDSSSSFGIFAQPDGAQLRAGVQVGPYKLEAAIGAGGMGEVFRAMDTRLHRTVAIKFLLQNEPADSARRRRFRQEAQAASALNHPNIIVLYDIANHNGIDFLVMEHVPGKTLNDLIPRDGMPLDAVVKLGAQVACALAAAHSAGIVHRDIKPANIMVTPDGQVKVLDFGLAKIAPQVANDLKSGMDTASQLTTPGMVVGTVSFMSPEQTRGESMDGRSDIFSLGCVLYQSATGQAPFCGVSTLAIMHQIAALTPAAPSSLRADLPEAFDQLLAACLEKDPKRRLASAADVAKRLESLSTPPDRPSHIPARRASRRSVAVIPFRFRAAQPEDKFLSLALAESVINRLASTGELLVRPTASVLRYAETDIECAQIARELNVDLVVEGSIQKMGARIRVLVQAIQTADSQTLHSAKHDGDTDDLFGLQDRIADSICDVFVPRKKSSEEPAAPPTKNPLAYELYMRALDCGAHLNKFDLGSAIGMLNRAVELDPDFADAWGRLAQFCSQLGMHLDPDPQCFERAERAIAKTLELDPVQCDALCARAQILWSPSRGFQNRPALRAINAALKIRPGRREFRQLRGVILAHLGYYDQAARDAEESLLVSPGYAMGVILLGLVALYRGDYDAADRIYDQSLALDPALLLANIFIPCAPIYLGRLGEAREKLQKARQMVPDEPHLASLEALIAAHEGNFRLAEQLADEGCSDRHKSVTHTHHSWHYSAGAYAICGRADKAIAQLRRCGDLGLPNYRLFDSDPNLRSLRGLPEFTALMSDLRRQHDQLRSEIDLACGDSTSH